MTVISSTCQDGLPLKAPRDAKPPFVASICARLAKVTERCLAYDIVLDDVSITHLAFSKEYAKAIEDKQVWRRSRPTSGTFAREHS